MVLRAVKEGEKAATKVKTVVQAAKDGSHRELLVALRDRVAVQVQDVNCPPRDLAALSRRLQEIAKEIAAIDSSDEEDDVGRAAGTPDAAWEAI